jgi:hypothetical protein
MTMSRDHDELDDSDRAAIEDAITRFFRGIRWRITSWEFGYAVEYHFSTHHENGMRWEAFVDGVTIKAALQSALRKIEVIRCQERIEAVTA